MSLNITSITNQYEDYAGYYVKAYEVGTLTPKAIYFDDKKLSGSIKVKVDNKGFFISAGGARVILFIEGYYDLYFFPTSKEADDNDITNAESFGERLVAEISGDTITKASETEYGTVRFAKDSELLINDSFPNNILVGEDQIDLMGDLSAQKQKATDEDLVTRDNTKWLSPKGIQTMIDAEGAIEDPIPQLEIGDTIWMDVKTASTRDDLLMQDNRDFNPVELPLLAAQSGYSQNGETKTLDMAYEAFGDIRPYVKAK